MLESAPNVPAATFDSPYFSMTAPELVSVEQKEQPQRDKLQALWKASQFPSYGERFRGLLKQQQLLPSVVVAVEGSLQNPCCVHRYLKRFTRLQAYENINVLQQV